MIKLVIFDASGTLLNDFSVTWKAASKILAHFGKQTDDQITFRKNFRLPYWNYYVDKGIAFDTVKFQIPALYSEFYLELIGGVELFPDVEEVTESLRNISVQLAVASQTPKEALSKILAGSAIHDKFSIILGLGDYPDPKPSPQSILIVLKELGVSATETIYVGDMAEDIISARGAGVIPVAIYRREAAYHARSYLEAEHPAFIIDSLKELIKIVVGNI
ncbi:MAG: HAD family hydrolase [Nitrososphaerales archaeon]